MRNKLVSWGYSEHDFFLKLAHSLAWWPMAVQPFRSKNLTPSAVNLITIDHKITIT